MQDTLFFDPQIITEELSQFFFVGPFFFDHRFFNCRNDIVFIFDKFTVSFDQLFLLAGFYRIDDFIEPEFINKETIQIVSGFFGVDIVGFDVVGYDDDGVLGAGEKLGPVQKLIELSLVSFVLIKFKLVVDDGVADLLVLAGTEQQGSQISDIDGAFFFTA